MNLTFLSAKLRNSYIWRRIAMERLTEPLHLNLLSLPVALLGGLRAKVAFDLMLRQHSAYGILTAADYCREQGLSKLAVCEFGVATGTGLLNMAHIAQKVSHITGREIKVFGFDTGKGMPPPTDWRDHPDLYSGSEFRMDVAALQARLPANTELVLGDVKDTIQPFLKRLAVEGYRLGFACLDVDYYTSARDALKIFTGPPELYAPLTLLYLDDVEMLRHNPWAGELLAVEEFNDANAKRKICRDEFLENRRIFRRANWIKHMRVLHVLDHPERLKPGPEQDRILGNPYLGIDAVGTYR